MICLNTPAMFAAVRSLFQVPRCDYVTKATPRDPVYMDDENL